MSTLGRRHSSLRPPCPRSRRFAQAKQQDSSRKDSAKIAQHLDAGFTSTEGDRSSVGIADTALTSSQRERANQGFTLLEVILSLAILAGALAALGEVMRLADRSASTAEDETQAQILATSIMEELLAGSRDLTAVSQSLIDTGDDPPWLYSVEIGQTQFDELVAVRVLVEQQLEPRLQPARFELVRWMPNPDYLSSDSGDGTSTSNTSSTTSSSSPSGTGGQK